MFSETDCPRLARGARLQWDAVEQRQLLLMPEGALVLNATAGALLELCDGRTSVARIIETLEDRYGGAGAAVREDVLELLERVAQRGLLVNAGA